MLPDEAHGEERRHLAGSRGVAKATAKPGFPSCPQIPDPHKL